jgi:DnaJ-class molecular chaperone
MSVSPDQNYYDLLEVPPSASKEEIQQAYDLARKTFGEQSLSTYSLFATEERQAILKRIEEAYRVLIDVRSRQEYDQFLSIKSSDSGAPAVPTPSVFPAAKIPSRNELEALLIENWEEGLSGRVLEKIRMHLAIPLQEIATKTKINITYLQSIEQDNYKGLPVEVYLRSYLIQYAQTIGFDPKKIADGYLRRWGRWQASNPQPL